MDERSQRQLIERPDAQRLATIHSPVFREGRYEDVTFPENLTNFFWVAARQSGEEAHVTCGFGVLAFRIDRTRNANR